MENECLVIVLAFIVTLMFFFAHQNSVDHDAILFCEDFDISFVIIHEYLVAAYILFVSLETFNDFFDDSLMLRVERLHELLSLLLALHETLGLVEQINIHHIEIVQVIQVVVEDDVQILLYFLLRKVVDVQITVVKACQVLYELSIFG